MRTKRGHARQIELDRIGFAAGCVHDDAPSDSIPKRFRLKPRWNCRAYVFVGNCHLTQRIRLKEYSAAEPDRCCHLPPFARIALTRIEPECGDNKAERSLGELMRIRLVDSFADWSRAVMNVFV